jgi:uncharacterized Ntn-hydrolase superfamily protein
LLIMSLYSNSGALKMHIKSAQFAGIVMLFLLLSLSSSAYATFSIVAVDPATGAVGGSGASCIDGSQIINSLHENIGAIHTQAWYLQGNQDRADSLMLLGLDPDSIIGWLNNNDWQGLPERRQYGVVTLAGPLASAAFTGHDNTDYKGHRIGPGYAIQGNILLGPEILDDMETAYLSTPGPLEDRLMAALEAADVPGADTRCLLCQKPAISAFVKVVLPGDGDTPYLYEFVNYTPCEENPIPQLRVKYDAWRQAQIADSDSTTANVDPSIIPADGSASAVITVIPLNGLGEPVTHGADVTIVNSGIGSLGEVIDNGDGSYTATVTAPTTAWIDTFSISVDAGGEVVEINAKPVVAYYICGDADASGDVDIDDVVYLIAYIFSGGPPPDPYETGDADYSGEVDIDDVVYLIAYIFSGGNDPCDPPGR